MSICYRSPDLGRVGSPWWTLTLTPYSRRCKCTFARGLYKYEFFKKSNIIVSRATTPFGFRAFLKLFNSLKFFIVHKVCDWNNKCSHVCQSMSRCEMRSGHSLCSDLPSVADLRWGKHSINMRNRIHNQHCTHFCRQPQPLMDIYV